jgi:hypothetical protein
MGVNRYYRDVNVEIAVDATTTFGNEGDHAIVLVGRMQKPVLKALDYAIAARHASIEAVHLSIDDESTAQLEREWAEQNIKIPLQIVISPYRDVAEPLYIVGHWWEHLLHNHKARRIRKRLMLVHGVTIALVPWLLDSSALVYGRRSRPMPGADRRGEPVRPVERGPDHHRNTRV